MHSLDQLQEVLDLAESVGIEVRKEWLGESAGGICRLGGKWLLFVDLSLPVTEQLSQAVEGLKRSGLVHEHGMDRKSPQTTRKMFRAN